MLLAYPLPSHVAFRRFRPPQALERPKSASAADHDPRRQRIASETSDIPSNSRNSLDHSPGHSPGRLRAANTPLADVRRVSTPQIFTSEHDDDAPAGSQPRRQTMMV